MKPAIYSSTAKYLVLSVSSRTMKLILPSRLIMILKIYFFGNLRSHLIQSMIIV